MSRSNQKFRISKPKSVLGRKLLIAGVAVAMGFGPVQTATAGPAIDEFVHTIECIGLLITDEAKHLEECGTNDNDAGPSDDITHSPPPPETESESSSY